jgi:hypothetical protein
VKRFLAWIAGGLAVYRLLRRRRQAPAPSSSLLRGSSPDPRAQALRAKLDETVHVDRTESAAVESLPSEADVSAETPAAEPEEQLTEEPEPVALSADPAESADPDDRRRSIQQEARIAIEQMRSRS